MLNRVLAYQATSSHWLLTTEDALTIFKQSFLAAIRAEPKQWVPAMFHRAVVPIFCLMDCELKDRCGQVEICFAGCAEAGCVRVVLLVSYLNESTGAFGAHHSFYEFAGDGRDIVYVREAAHRFCEEIVVELLLLEHPSPTASKAV